MVRFGGYAAGVKCGGRVVRTRYFVLGAPAKMGDTPGRAIMLA